MAVWLDVWLLSCGSRRLRSVHHDPSNAVHDVCMRTPRSKDTKRYSTWPGGWALNSWLKGASAANEKATATTTTTTTTTTTRKEEWVMSLKGKEMDQSTTVYQLVWLWTLWPLKTHTRFVGWLKETPWTTIWCRKSAELKNFVWSMFESGKRHFCFKKKSNLLEFANHS